ncbi:AAA family ATPase [Bacillus cereus]
MLRTLEVEDFFEKGNNIFLDFSDGLTILTGDNGAGKTTLLNLIFNIVNGDFKTLNKSIFSKIILNLDVEKVIINKKNKSQIVYKIEVEKINEVLQISYFLHEKHFVIRLKRPNFPYFEYTYELLYPKDNSIMDEADYFNSLTENLSDLIRNYKELEFINLLKKNVIYFPTYRRIDSDIIQLLEQNYPVSNEEDLYEINRTINNFPNDRRVVGVNDNDIDDLYNSYSEKCRKLNSEGLNIVLKSFVEEMIVSTYNNNSRNGRKNKRPSELYDKAPEQLIDLSRQLGIGNINEKEIKEYFAKQKKVAEISKRTKVNLSIEAKNGSMGESVEELLTESLEDVLLSSLLSVGKNTNLVMELINLYDQHMKKVNKELEAYEYLKKSFRSFFKNKITLSLENYNLKLSQPFKHLSTGEKQLITILSYAALSLKMESYQPLIIIDEPELSLHISWQMKLLEKLLELPNINIVLATHSPYVANSDYENYSWQLGDIDEY